MPSFTKVKLYNISIGLDRFLITKTLIKILMKSFVK